MEAPEELRSGDPPSLGNLAPGWAAHLEVGLGARRPDLDLAGDAGQPQLLLGELAGDKRLVQRRRARWLQAAGRVISLKL